MQGDCCVNSKNMDPIDGSEFFEEHLLLSHVWTWNSSLYSSEGSLVPVPLTEDALSEADSLLIHANFELATGTKLHGLVVYDVEDEDIFAMEVFSGREKFTFNKHAPDLSCDELKRLALFLHQDVGTLLPVRYAIVPKELSIVDGEFTF